VGFVDVLGKGSETLVGNAAFRPADSSYLCRHSFEKISREACAATQKSLTNSGVPTYKITVPRLNAETLGALFFFFETATAFAGELYGVNAFDQPGVEESKKLLHAALNA
jgi:glucose-6-phosphate isomerase